MHHVRDAQDMYQENTDGMYRQRMTETGGCLFGSSKERGNLCTETIRR